MIIQLSNSRERVMSRRDTYVTATMSTKCRLKGVLAYDILKMAKRASGVVLL